MEITAYFVGDYCIHFVATYIIKREDLLVLSHEFGVVRQYRTISNEVYRVLMHSFGVGTYSNRIDLLRLLSPTQ